MIPENKNGRWSGDDQQIYPHTLAAADDDDVMLWTGQSVEEEQEEERNSNQSRKDGCPGGSF